VPSISLVQQNLKEWGRHAKEDFDYLVVCSDETVGSDRDDPAMRYIADRGVKPTTVAKKIAEFLAKRRSGPALVISTYQSCDRVAKGQAKAKKKFDLTICDEAHRLVGHVVAISRRGHEHQDQWLHRLLLPGRHPGPRAGPGRGWH
jgi:predicted helicase